MHHLEKPLYIPSEISLMFSHKKDHSQVEDQNRSTQCGTKKFCMLLEGKKKPYVEIYYRYISYVNHSHLLKCVWKWVILWVLSTSTCYPFGQQCSFPPQDFYRQWEAGTWTLTLLMLLGLGKVLAFSSFQWSQHEKIKPQLTHPFWEQNITHTIILL